MLKNVNKKFNELTLDDLERHLWEAAHIITGPIDASDYKTYIFPILFFKRVCDVYDEEFDEALAFYSDEEMARAPEQHRIEVPKGCHWKDIIAATRDVGKALKAAFLCIEKSNDRLYGIFGDAQWTNKERLPDHLLLQLLNHFNKVNLGVKSVRDDDMGRAYEYLIKRFADKANKKAGEFYTPRSIVRLMVNMLDPQPRETVYDPACGTGGMLLETVLHVGEQGGDPRLLTLKGQEKNLTTEAIARMNLYLHGMEDFEIRRGDTLRDPRFLTLDHLEQFDCVIANPPFSLKEWGHDKWSSDPFNRHTFGLAPKKNGVKEVTRERAFSSLSDKNLEKLVDAYFAPENHEDIASLVDITEIRENLYNLSIPLYVSNGSSEDDHDLASTIEAWQVGRVELKKQSEKLFKALEELGFRA